MDISESTLRTVFERTPLFAGKSWRLSPRPFALEAASVARLLQIGADCAAFYHALEALYFEDAESAALLDRGKPARLLAHARHDSVRGQIPAVIRPDLLITQDGFALTELDSVPGGIGLTGFLGRLYGGAGARIVGGEGGMAQGFAHVINALARGKRGAKIAVAVSDEAAGYLPEFQWLARQMGEAAPIVCRAEDLRAAQGGVCANVGGATQRIDGIYRFFELFDWEKLPAGLALAEAVERGELAMTPPMRPFQEEKLALALLHAPRLAGFWEAHLGQGAFARMRALVPRGWVVLPEHAPDSFDSWLAVKRASQKQRALILKRSGFHETAWGARSVTFGADVPSDVWAQKIDDALSEAARSPFILQEYAKPVRVPHAVYGASGVAREEGLRARLCAYYFGDTPAELGGVLATLCPADKKIIHGMSAAALVPCAARD